MSKELKPCPFCGSEAEIITVDGIACVECTCCHVQTEGLFDEEKDKAIKVWNTRPNPWHTGTPTESVNKDGSAIPYLVTNKTGNCYDVSRWHSENGGYWGVSWFEVFAWQKIEPYKEKTE